MGLGWDWDWDWAGIIGNWGLGLGLGLGCMMYAVCDVVCMFDTYVIKIVVFCVYTLHGPRV